MRRYFIKPGLIFAALFALASCNKSGDAQDTNDSGVSYPVVETSVVIDGVKVTYQCPQTVEYSREHGWQWYYPTAKGYKTQKSSYVIFQPLEETRLFRFNLMKPVEETYAGPSKRIDDLVIVDPGVLPYRSGDPVASLTMTNELLPLDPGERKSFPLRFIRPELVRNGEEKDIDEFLVCVSYDPKREEYDPPLGSLSVEELSRSYLLRGLYPTNERAPGEWAHGFELCNKVRIVYTD